MIVTEKKKFDIRVNLILVLISTFGMLIYNDEKSYIFAFAIAMIFLVFQGGVRRCFSYTFLYILFIFVSHITLGLKGFQTIWIFSNVGRHILIQLSLLSVLKDISTGEILSVFSKLRLPKVFGISTVVLLRFIPTLRGELYSIRNSLKFRGIGYGLGNTLLHLPINFKLTLIPLLIRTVRISEEMTAAAMVRGVEINNDVSSYVEVKWKRKDTIAGVVFGLLLCIPVLLKLLEVKI